MLQTLTLDLWIDDCITNLHCFLTNSSSTVSRPWPRLQVTAVQTNGTVSKQYSLDLNAAPLRELWFSTARNFVAGIWNSPTNQIGAGELLSTGVRRVKTNQQLTAAFGIMPPAAEVGLKDLDVLPGGEVAFSVEQDIFGENASTSCRFWRHT